MSYRSVINKVRTIHKDYVIIVMDTGYFKVFNNDTFIFKYLFSYKPYKNYVTTNSNKYINYVYHNLEERNINYLSLDKIDNYRVIRNKKYNNNTYYKYLKISKIYTNRINRLNKVKKKINNDIEKELYNNILSNITRKKVKSELRRLENLLNGR